MIHWALLYYSFVMQCWLFKGDEYNKENPCLNGTFGRECGNKCNCKNKYEVCNKTNGFCHTGCRDGFFPPTCLAQCPVGKFGPPNCDRSCKCKGSLCNDINGKCVPEICSAGYTGQNCQSPCDVGRYGEYCASMCNCLDNSKCNYVNGSCPDCPAGYTHKEMSCKTKCKLGRFGKDCSKICHCKNRTEACDHVTGNCKTGCGVNWTGIHCQKEYFKPGSHPQPVAEANTFPGYIIALIAVAAVLTFALAAAVSLFAIKVKRLKREHYYDYPTVETYDKSSTTSSKSSSKKVTIDDTVSFSDNSAKKVLHNFNTDDDATSFIKPEKKDSDYTYSGSSQRSNKSHSGLSHGILSKKTRRRRRKKPVLIPTGKDIFSHTAAAMLRHNALYDH